MPELLETKISCGIRQLEGFCRDSLHYNPSDKIPPKQVLLEAFDYDKETMEEDWFDAYPTAAGQIKFGIVLFSDSVRRGNGKRFAQFIIKQKLGDVVESNVIVNPNTHRQIQLWTWYLDREALVKWFKANKEPEAKLWPEAY